MFHVFKLALFCLLFLSSVSSFSQANNDCAKFQKQSKAELRVLYNRIEFLAEPLLFSKNELIQIVLPEYVTTSASKHLIEQTFLKMSYAGGIEGFDHFSFGPFQMQPQFILNVINDYPIKELDKKHLIRLREVGYEYLIDNLEYFFSVQVQWEILIMYERNFILKHGIKETVLSSLIRLYNSGTIKKPNNFFSKIDCDDKTYEEWSYLISKWVN